MKDLKNKKWITCTPIAFRGDEQTFFSRDSGLCCRALQSLGCEAKVVMPEPAWDDEPDVMRVRYDQLSDPAFWREQDAEAVIFYSWAHPRYADLARAIKDAGLKLFVNVDTGGLFSLFVEPRAYIRLLWSAEREKRGWLVGVASVALRLAWQCVGIHRHLSRLKHLECADAIGVVSPIAAERVQKYVRVFGRNDIAKKITFIPHPINPRMKYNGAKKEKKVIAVGRWYDPVKRPDLLMEIAAELLSQDPSVRFVVVGKDATRIASRIKETFHSAQERVFGFERLEHEQLCEQLHSSQVSLCTSRSESFHIASGEALLCGCSIVGPASPLLPPLPYFTSGEVAGRLAEDSVLALVAAIREEFGLWQSGQRDADMISEVWRERIEAQAVVQHIDQLLSAKEKGVRDE